MRYLQDYVVSTTKQSNLSMARGRRRHRIPCGGGGKEFDRRAVFSASYTTNEGYLGILSETPTLML